MRFNTSISRFNNIQPRGPFAPVAQAGEGSQQPPVAVAVPIPPPPVAPPPVDVPVTQLGAPADPLPPAAPQNVAQHGNPVEQNTDAQTVIPLTPTQVEIFDHIPSVAEYFILFLVPFIETYVDARAREIRMWEAAQALANMNATIPPAGHRCWTHSRRHLTAARSYLVAQAKNNVGRLFKGLSSTQISRKALYMLTRDRFTCNPKHAFALVTRFQNELFIDIIYERFFNGPKCRGFVMKDFVDRINGTFIALVCATVHHQISAWSTGTFVKPGHFTESSAGAIFQRLKNTWNALPDVLKNRILEWYRLSIRARIKASGVRPAPRIVDVEALQDNDLQRAMDFVQQGINSVTAQMNNTVDDDEEIPDVIMEAPLEQSDLPADGPADE
jgi:hypothetical protein